MNRILLPLAALAAAALLSASTAGAATYVPGEVIVKYRDGTSGVVQQDVVQSAGTQTALEAPGGTAQLEIEDGDSVRETVQELQSDPSVAYARPNYVAHASAFLPNDPGFAKQWNLSGPFGINMPEAWDLATARGAPGGAGAVVAVLDTGVAYQNWGRYRRAPDLRRFARGYDFVDFDRHPNDQNGHGTHVAGTIAQSTNNGIGTAGIAYMAKIMPVRVLDADGAGDTFSISRGIRFAARRRVDVINLSLEFDSSVRASQIPDIVSALRYARKRGVLVVAAAGNQAGTLVAYPARARSTWWEWRPRRSAAARPITPTAASHTDLAAPGGGVDAANSDDALRRRRVPARRRRSVHLPADLHVKCAQVRPPARLRGHVDGGAPRGRRRCAGGGHRAAGSQPQAGRCRAPAGEHRSRHRRTRALTTATATACSTWRRRSGIPRPRRHGSCRSGVSRPVPSSYG